MNFQIHSQNLKTGAFVFCWIVVVVKLRFQRNGSECISFNGFDSHLFVKLGQLLLSSQLALKHDFDHDIWLRKPRVLIHSQMSIQVSFPYFWFMVTLKRKIRKHHKRAKFQVPTIRVSESSKRRNKRVKVQPFGKLVLCQVFRTSPLRWSWCRRRWSPRGRRCRRGDPWGTRTRCPGSPRQPPAKCGKSKLFSN